jgi:glycogen synthase
MRILLTADTVGGVWTHALDLCRGLERHDAHVVLATMGAPLSAAQRQELRRCRNVELAESTYRLEWMPDPWADVAAAGEWLLSLEQRVRPDLVHVNGYSHAALGWSAPVLLGAHSCVLSWWRAVHGCDAPPEWDRYRDSVGAGIAAADMVVAPTRAILDAIVAGHAAPRAARVVPNGRSLDTLPLGARDAFGRYRKPRERTEPVVLAAGRLWDAGKNLAALAAAAPLIRWPVYVAGSDAVPGGGRRPLGGVHHLGVLSAPLMEQWHRRASIFVHPSLYEPFGLAPLEAALCSTALVLADIATLREVWNDAALYVPPDDPDAIAVAVNRLAADPLLLTQRATDAWRQARTMTAQRMADAYHEIYRALTGPASPAGSPSAGVAACA